jgi:hypothetical protein
MKLHFLWLALVCGLFVPIVLGQTVAIEKQRTELVLENVKADNVRTLFVYCLPPTGSTAAIRVFRSGHPDWIRAPSRRETDEPWIREDFRPPENGWQSKLNVVCTIESDLSEEEVRDRAKFFILQSDEPLKWGDVHETSSNFFKTPVADSTTESGQFYYELLWGADVTIEIAKKTKTGYAKPSITISDQWKDHGRKHTEWNKQHKFNTMDDGVYKCQLILRRNQGAKNETMRILIFVTFKRDTKERS